MEKLAVIWDMDGVIADTAQLHFRAWRTAFGAKNVGFTYEDFRHTFGQRNDTIIKTILGSKVALELIDSIAREKEKQFRYLVKEDLEALPGAVELIKSVHKTGFLMALASSAPLKNIELVLAKLKLKKYFPVITSAEDVTKGKPDPQVFLITAKRLNVAPERCLVIEDSVAGVSAAKRAGIKCIAVTNTNTTVSLKEADLIVNSLKEISIDTIKSLWTNQSIVSSQ